MTLQPAGLANLAGSYREYPSSGREPDLVVEIETIPGFAEGRRRGPEYPAFQRSLRAPNVVLLSRFDAEGEVILPPESEKGPIRARFHVGESANTLEAAVRIGMSIALPRLGGLILHASAIAAHGRAWVFAGMSGAGKSTIATMLTEARPSLIKLSDELVIVKPREQGGFAAHVTPFIGGRGLPHRTVVPVQGIHFLRQASHHHRARLAWTDALRELMRHVLVYVVEPGTASSVLAAASALAREIPCHHLEFAKNPAVLEVLEIA